VGWVQAADNQRRVEPHVAARGVYDDLYPEYLGLDADLRERFAARAQPGEHRWRDARGRADGRSRARRRHRVSDHTTAMSRAFSHPNVGRVLTPRGVGSLPYG